jgi:hypothetical protein
LINAIEVMLQAAGGACRLLEDPAVGAAWDRPSVLPEFSVRGLSGHFAAQVFNVSLVIEAPRRPGGPISIDEHYRRAVWVGADLHEAVNADVRVAGEQLAADGWTALARRAAAATEELRLSLPRQPMDRAVYVPWAGWSLSLHDFLVTRLLEIAVHSDDLAVSVGIPTPTLTADHLEEVMAVLFRLSVRRHGQSAVLRALTRAERAPDRITAI